MLIYVEKEQFKRIQEIHILGHDKHRINRYPKDILPWFRKKQYERKENNKVVLDVLECVAPKN
jgi:hypothetical protein